ncbi:hypothetical protein [Streptomyces erythrochromogenes]|uniref:hypothetical protein n=1 Tax=Streptomyces erythrochromogenes TaxID=285574 RepID=UPI00225361D3|nr:hypothetical protein [Streptomyces erythrochromogenes]MCX5584243.1 hypothetical protein [Streptomyces erythrochromogenes]
METCSLCGRTWGVVTQPRSNVLCAPCGRPAPNRRPGAYWHLRATTGHPVQRYRSPEWWDQQTSLADLKHAARLAAGMEAS